MFRGFQACLNQKCQDVSVFGVEECRAKCNGHGFRLRFASVSSLFRLRFASVSPPFRLRFVSVSPPASGLGGSVDSGPATSPRNSDPVKVSLLVLFLFVLPSLLLFVALRFPRLRHSFLSPLHKGRHNRTPVMERADRRNGEQVRPLRFHLNAPPDIPLIPPHKEVHDRPTAPTKPLPPRPHPKPSPTASLCPATPPLSCLEDQLHPTSPSPLTLAHLHSLVWPPPPPNRHGAAANPAGPKRRPPLRPAGAQRVDSSAL
ncbi:hypothetical protein KUCAC02_032719 [Chaenocephalus aceratus]|nr:hypothetical protein KUCAC02_032719 [Chaenocephalus aceratus]